MSPAQTSAPTDQIPDISKITEGLSPTQTVVVVIAVMVITLAVFVVPRVWPERKPPAPASPPAQLPPAAAPTTTTTLSNVPTVPPPPGQSATVVADEVKASQALLNQLVAGLERQLEAAHAERERVEQRSNLLVEELRKQLGTEQEKGWQMRAELVELRNKLEAANQEVVHLEAQLRILDPHRYGGWRR